MVRTIGIGMLLVLCVHVPSRAELVTVSDFTDILFWAGSGTNQAALVLYYNAPNYGDGGSPAAVAWGYRWNGTQTQADMLLSLAGQITVSGSAPIPPSPQPGSDPRLAVDVSYFDYSGVTGYLVTALRYDQVGLANPWQQIERVMDNTTPPPESGFVDIAPYEGFSGAAGEWPAGGSLDLIANTGISQTLLADGGWYGFVEALYEVQPNDGNPIYVGFPTTFTFAQPVAAVPEPSTWALAVGAAATAVAAARRRFLRT